MSAERVTGLVIFAITYGVISARRLSWVRLDRPAAAMLGAVACVALGVLTPAQALAAIDGSTILLLLGVMGMGALLSVDGFFDHLESLLVARTKTPTRLLGALLWGSGVLSALITNDAVCVLGAPLVVRLIQRHRLPPLPFLLVLATAANTGSVATLVGNPQNMLCGTLGHLSYREHLLLMAPVAVIALGMNHALLHWSFRKQLAVASLTPGVEPAVLPLAAIVSLVVIGLTAVAYTFGADLAWTSAAGFSVLMLLRRRDPRELWPRIDWSLLLFFAALFVVVEGLMQSGVPGQLFARYPLNAGIDNFTSHLRLSTIFLIGSNIVSNVPFILVVRDQMAALPNPTLAWEVLAMASTFAGNLTLLGSVANIIVAESAREIGGLGFRDHFRVGFPLGLTTTIVGAAWIWWIASQPLG